MTQQDDFIGFEGGEPREVELGGDFDRVAVNAAEVDVDKPDVCEVDGRAA